MDQAGSQRLSDLQQRWAQIQYQMPKDTRADAFEKLAGDAATFVHQYPGTPEPLIWEGIINSSWAGATGGLGALGKVKAAKASLEQAMKLDPNALQGSAYTSLGTLYDQVPGWPIGFGDAEMADKMLRKALQINPNGIDSNYFWLIICIGKSATLKLPQPCRKPCRHRPGRGVSWLTRAAVPISMLYSRPSRTNRTEHAAVAG